MQRTASKSAARRINEWRRKNGYQPLPASSDDMREMVMRRKQARHQHAV